MLQERCHAKRPYLTNSLEPALCVRKMCFALCKLDILSRSGGWAPPWTPVGPYLLCHIGPLPPPDPQRQKSELAIQPGTFLASPTCQGTRSVFVMFLCFASSAAAQLLSPIPLNTPRSFPFPGLCPQFYLPWSKPSLSFEVQIKDHLSRKPSPTTPDWGLSLPTLSSAGAFHQSCHELLT